jgi:hypothetical protein
MFYAQLSAENICFGVSHLNWEIESDRLVPLDFYDTDKLWRKYEGGTWSKEKYEPLSEAAREILG